MPDQYTCPECGKPISLDDVNVAQDIALCRACSKTSSFALVSGKSAIDLAVLEHPPKRTRAVRGFRGGVRVTHKVRGFMLLFLLPFTLAWGGGSMTGIYGRQIAQGSFDLGMSLFGLPFLVGTVVLVGANLYLLFGGWAVSMQGGKGVVVNGIGDLGWRRKFEYGPDTKVFLADSGVSTNDVPQKGICVKTGSKQLIFGATLPEDAKRFIAAAMLKEIGEQRFR